MADCKGHLRTCKSCGRRFHPSDTTPICPECNTDRRCGKDAVTGYNYCEVHGGPNPSKNYWGRGRGMTTGASSSHGLTKLAAKYNELTKNGRWLSNQRSIQILRTRMEELLERIDQNDMPDRLGKLYGLWQQFRREQISKPTDAILTANQIDDAFEAARTDFAAWTQLLNVMELDRKMVESEVKIAKEIKAIMTAEEGVELVAKLLASVITAVGAQTIPEYDKGQLLKRVQYEFTRLIGESVGEDSAEGLGDRLAEVIDA